MTRRTGAAQAPDPPNTAVSTADRLDELRRNAERTVIQMAQQISEQTNGRPLTDDELERLRDGRLAVHGTELRAYDDEGNCTDTQAASDTSAVWRLGWNRLAETSATSAPKTSRATPQPRTRSRESHRSRPGQRRTRRATSGRTPDDPDSPSDSDPPPLPYRIAGPAVDSSGVEAAFLKILHRRHPGTSWEVVA